MRDLVRVDISTTRHLGHGGCVCGSGEDDPGNLFSLYFIRKDKISITHCRQSKYDSCQEIWIGTPESSDTCKIKLPKFSASKCGTNLGRDGGREIIQLRPPYITRVIKA